MSAIHVRTGRWAVLAGLLLAASTGCTRDGKRAPDTRVSIPVPTDSEIPQLLQTAEDIAIPAEQRVAAITGLGLAGSRVENLDSLMSRLWANDDHAIATAAAGALRRHTGKGQLSFARTAVVGASVSAGFMGSPVAVELDRGLSGAREVRNLADVFFFRSPSKNGVQQVEAAQAFEPTVVLALDFVFWYAYVAGADLPYRRSRVRSALRLLERFEVPVIVGDIPDMRRAKTWMLKPAVVPPADHLEALNREIKTWATGRPNVHLAPLAAWGRPLLTGDPVRDGDATIAAEDLLSADGLHLNARGVRYLLRQVDRDLEQAFPETPTAALRVAQ